MKPLLVLVCCVAPFGAEPPPSSYLPPAERCAALIALFDEIVVSRFDHRILMLEDYELAEARDGRHQAEAECRRGQYAFGIDLIESALGRIGVVPGPKEGPLPD